MIKDRAINQAAFGFALMRDDRSNIHAIRCIRAIIKRIADEDRARDVRSVAYDVGKNLVRSLSQAPVLTGQRKHQHDLHKESGPAFWAGPL